MALENSGNPRHSGAPDESARSSGGSGTERGEGERTQKTRQALLDSLIGLVREKRYDEFAVGDIVADADVGRSTFYDHYRGKDDMLVETMGHMLAVMAGVASERGDVEQLAAVLQHFQDNQKFARHFFASSPGLPVMARITRELARRIECSLREPQAGAAFEPAVPLAWIALTVAEGQFAFIRSWLADGAACAALQLAQTMRASARGQIAGARLRSGA